MTARRGEKARISLPSGSVVCHQTLDHRRKLGFQRGQLLGAVPFVGGEAKELGHLLTVAHCYLRS